ncbi:MAG: hypothetical protein LBL59_00065 [Xanthomonadaceae bacterium]|jgi:hypothetical protein|nr:hypothetical protein [Xanthomonadaceae bacterium]
MTMSMPASEVQRKRDCFHLDTLPILFRVLAALSTVATAMLGTILTHGITHEETPYEDVALFTIIA